MPREPSASHPCSPLFLSRMQALLGADYPAFEQSLAEPSRSGLRLNTLKLTTADYQALTPYPLSPVPWCPAGFLLSPDSRPGKHPHHAAGLYYLQEPSAMAAAEVLAPLPGERILDLSAAPGGKTTHLAALMQNQGLLVANEIHARRVWDLAENLERFGVRIAAITNETPQRLAFRFPYFFDRVLLDAPCSGEGMFRKSESARAQWSVEHVQSCALRQQDILHAAASMVKPGGSLLYSTCTYAPDENEMVIGNFLQHHPDFALTLPPQFPGFSAGIPTWAPQYSPYQLDKTVRIWPHRSLGEGHFIARLQRLGASSSKHDSDPASPLTASTIPTQLARQFQDFFADTLTKIDLSTDLSLSGSYLYQVSSGLPYFADIKWIHPGWWVGVFKKGRFEPSHALALALTASQAQRTHPLSANDPAVLAYLRGESLSSPGDDGWTLVTVDDFPLGWGKRVQNLLKNAYPHGLRWH